MPGFWIMQTQHTLLVVDDDPDVVQSLQDLLRQEYHVLGATSGRQALQLLKKHEVHVVMPDQRMPEMSRVAFLKQVRGQHPDALRLLMTGYAEFETVVDAINEGAVFLY